MMIQPVEFLDVVVKEKSSLKAILHKYNIQIIQSKSIQQICTDNGIHCDFMLSLLNTDYNNQTIDKAYFDQYDSDLIVDYLFKSHAYYLSKSIPELEQNLDYLLRNFKFSHSYLAEIEPLFLKFRGEFTKHIELEEHYFLPYAMEVLTANAVQLSDFNPKKIKELLESFSAERFITNHGNIEETLKEIRKKLVYHSINGKITFIHNIFLHQVSTLEQELRNHDILEEEIIFKRVLNAEKELWEKLTHFKLYNLSSLNGSFI